MSPHAESHALASTTDLLASVTPAASATPAHDTSQHEASWWQSGLHNLQRSFENVHAVKHSLHPHGSALAGETALGSTAGASQAAPALQESEQMVDALRRAHPPGGIVGALGRLLGGFGVIGGGAELVHGYHELKAGDTLQGTLDTVAGLGGLGAGGLAMLNAPLAGAVALPAAGLGMMAYGNHMSREWNLFGEGADHRPRSSFDMVGDYMQQAYTGADKTLGGGVAGKVVGGAMAGMTGLATGTVAGAANVVMGVLGAGLGAGRFLKQAALAALSRRGS